VDEYAGRQYVGVDLHRRRSVIVRMTRGDRLGPAAKPSNNDRMDLDQSSVEFEAQRSRLFGLAYRLLGSAAEAEDVVQEGFLRWHAAEKSYIESPPAWLTKVVTNLSLTVLDSARVRRERYVGEWLPEPLLTGAGLPDPIQIVERAESVSLALLVLLERLTPVERGVFVLREAFDYSHREIAEVFDLSEVNCRQILRRAAGRLGEPQARFVASSSQHQEITARFLAAALAGDLPGLERFLAAGVTVWTDAGGHVSAPGRPIYGRARVARYVAGMRQWVNDGVEFVTTEVNAEPAVVGWVGGRVVGVMVVEISGGKISGVRSILNPDKLMFLGRQLSHLIGLLSSGGDDSSLGGSNE
jgi:RNA polymerase sigma-70 factor (ECF subfamily)